jgi:hypothetical protein
MVERGSYRDPGQPGTNGGLATKRGKRADGVLERLLQEVLQVAARPHHAVEHALEKGRLPAEDPLEGRSLTAAARLDQGIGINLPLGTAHRIRVHAL